MTTSVVAILFQHLFGQNRTTSLPNYIYLDSAHEKDETFIELSLCWNCLINNSILFGDDWDWQSVRDDVIKFSNHKEPPITNIYIIIKYYRWLFENQR